MNSKHPQGQKQNKEQRPSSIQERPPVSELTPAHTGLQDPAQLGGLPHHVTSRNIRQATILQMQQRHGNVSVQRMLAQTAVVQCCGATPCNCSDEERERHAQMPTQKTVSEEETSPTVQRAASDFQVRGRHRPRSGEDENFVFFELAEASLNSEERDKIDDFAASLDAPTQAVELVGFASEEGPAPVNTQLVNDRINSVAQHLIDQGHNPGAITRTPRRAASAPARSPT